MAWVRRDLCAEFVAARLRATHGYPPEYGAPHHPRVPEAVQGDSIMGTHSLLPAVMEGVFTALRELYDPKLPLTRREHEMIATRVSALNDCFY